jgi:hypothetical protein
MKADDRIESLRKGFLLFTFHLSLFTLLTGCAHEQRHEAVLTPSAVPVINAVSSARLRAEKLKAEVPQANRAEVQDLSADLEQAQSSLAAYSTQVNTQSVALVSAQHDLVDKDAKISTLTRNLHQTAKERDFYPFLFAVAAAVVTLRIYGESVSRLPFGMGIFGPFILLVAGGAAGFIISRTVAAYGSRFIP